MDNNFPLISIALCTFNGDQYIEEQLNSIVNQSYPNIEVIILDDCSTDKTRDIIQQKFNLPFVKLYTNEANIGFTKNFEKVLSFCSGEIISLADQDDIWYLDKVKIQYEHLKDNLLIYADSELIEADGTPLNVKISDKFNFVKGSNNLAFLFTNCISGHSIMFKRELLEVCLPIPDKMYHDAWLAFVASSIGKIDFVDMTLVKYRQHTNSVTKFHKPKISRALKYRNKYRAFKLIESQLKAYQSFEHLSFTNKTYIQKIAKKYHVKWDSRFNVRLFVLLVLHVNDIYAIPKISLFNKIFRIIKEVNHLFLPKKLARFYKKQYLR